MAKKNASTESSPHNLDIKTEWQLEKLFGYSGIDDQQIVKDVKKGINEVTNFARKWSNRDDWLSNPSILKQALDEYEKPSSANRALYYLFLKGDLDLSNTEIQGLESRLENELSKAVEKSFFFTLKLGKIDEKIQAKFLGSKALEKYHFFLSELFESAKHHLSDSEERILSRTSEPRSDLWSKSLSKTLGTAKVLHQGKQLTLSEAHSVVAASTDHVERRDLHGLLMNYYESVDLLSEPVMNVIAKNRQISDELRGYKKSYEATVKGYGNTTKELEALVKSVTDNNDISHQYYRLTRDILGLDHLEYADRSAPIGKVKQKFNFNQSYQLLANIIGEFDSEMGVKFQNYFKEGRVDVYPKVGKRGGAYQAGTEDKKLGNYILLNDTGSFDNFMTMAHEFGHAFHSEYSTTNQSPIYRGYSTAVAETASTFFEQVAFYSILPTLSESDQMIALHGKLTNAIATIFRQIAFVNYEIEFHAEVRKSGYVSHRDLAAMMNKNVSNYLGKTVRLQDNDGAFYATLASTHLYRPFYVYSYAYGELISMALYKQYKNDPEKGREAVKKFISLGSSMKPRDIFAAAGIKVGPALWQTGLDQLRDDLQHLKQLHKKLS